MTIQVMVPSTEPKCPRGDRLQEEPSAKNAQGLFPPEACIFVGKYVIRLSGSRPSTGLSANEYCSLSTKVPTETLAEDLKSVFTRFGACHVKIKQDKKKGLPGAFVQFEVSFHLVSCGTMYLPISGDFRLTSFALACGGCQCSSC